MKFMTNIKTLAALLMAGAAFTACSSSDEIIEQPANPTAPKVYTMVIKASKGGDATTRALSLNGKTLNAYWSGNETIEVEQNGETIGSASAAPSSNGVTTITATLTSAPDPTEDLNFYLGGKDVDFTGQVGLLTGTGGNSISEKYDYANDNVGANSYTVDNVNKTVNQKAGSSEPLEFGAAQQAIIKFTLKNSDGSALPSNPTAFTVTDGTSTVELTSIPASTYTANGDGVLYVAFPASGSAKTITLTATVGSDTYTYTTSGTKTFALRQYYEITVKMTKQAAVGHALSSAVVGEVVGSDGLAYAGASYNNLPTGVTRLAKVCYVDGNGNGLALALNDEGAMDWYSAVSACDNHTPAIAGGTWKLATQAEWNNMINANGVAGLRDGFTSVGGSNLIQGHKVYMSSTDVANSSGQAAYAYDFNMGSWTTGSKTSTGANARACLAFTAAPAARALSEATTDDIGKIAGADGYIYDNAAAAVDAGSTAAAMIAYVGSATQPTPSNINASMATYNHGLAIALTEVSNTSGAEGIAGMTWADAGTAASAYTRARPSASSEWFLPSVYQWMWMLNGCGGGTPTTTLTDVAYSYGNFQTKMQNCGGTQMQSLGSYWSSTLRVENDYHVWRYTFYNGGRISYTGKVDNCLVRSAFAF